MKLIEQPRLELLYNRTNIIIPLQPGQVPQANEILTAVGEIDPDKDYEIIIKAKSKKRSLDQNAYLWGLLGKLASKQRISNIEAYRHYMRDYGVYEIVPVKEEAIPRWIAIWESRGSGWCCEDLGECRSTKGYHNIRSIYGSSTYNSAEFSRLLDAVIADCQDEGIPTDTPEEVARLKKLWEEAEKKRNG